jgi:D-alanine transaminase
MSLIAYVNGEFVPLNEAKIHVEDRGFQFADGVYEVAICHDGRFFLLEEHLQRLERSCRSIYLEPPLPLPRLEALVRETYQKNRLADALVYIQITRGVAPRSHGFPLHPDPSLIITVRPLPKPDEQKCQLGAKGITLADIRWKRCDIKSISLLASALGKQKALTCQADEAFWLDQEGHVLEGCSTNIFAVIKGTLVTHPLDQQILGGITRSLVLSLASETGIPVMERPWKLSEHGISECLMSSTTNAVLPVTSIDGKPIGTGKAGPVSRKLRALILERMK